MNYDFRVNEHPTIQTLHVGHEKQAVLILDDFARDAESLVRYAAEHAQFKPSTLAYPGVVAPAPDPYADGLVTALLPLLGASYGVNPDTAFLRDCFFAIATVPPEQLHFGQRLPHVDDFDPGLFAVLHYLCDPSQGGTALYRHRATGYESLTMERTNEVHRLNAPELANAPLPAAYPSASTPLYEQTAYLDAVFNRVVVYRSRILHSMAASRGTRFHPDPRIGRLTINTFLKFDLTPG
jgi:hypothetical protein